MAEDPADASLRVPESSRDLIFTLYEVPLVNPYIAKGLHVALGLRVVQEIPPSTE